MKNPGTFAVSRAAFDHPMFKDEPFSEREAWIWMIGAAAWRPMKVRVANHLIALDRGEFAFSIRFMAERFDWSKSRVHRFITRLEHEGMISKCSKTGTAAGQQPDHSPTHLKICNYNKYAFDGERHRDSDGTRTGTAAGQQRDKEEELKELKEDNEGKRAAEREAWDISDALLDTIGVDRDEPSWFGTRRRAEMWLRNGWSRELILATAKKIMRGRDGPPSIKYFEAAFANAHVSQQAPLPAGKPNGAFHGKTKRGALDVVREILAAEPDSQSIEADRNVVVSLPQRRMGGP